MDIYHIGAILSVAGSFIGLISKLKPILTKLNELLELQKIQSDSIRDLLRQHIIEKTNEIFSRGYITEEEIYCLRKLYDDYKALGGNSTGDGNAYDEKYNFGGLKMKINWKIRFKNKTFIISFLTVFLTFVYQILGIFEIVPQISKEQVTQIIMLIVNLLAGLGILVDPTTKGIQDSERALNYK